MQPPGRWPYSSWSVRADVPRNSATRMHLRDHGAKVRSPKRRGGGPVDCLVAVHPGDGLAAERSGKHHEITPRGCVFLISVEGRAVAAFSCGRRRDGGRCRGRRRSGSRRRCGSGPGTRRAEPATALRRAFATVLLLGGGPALAGRKRTRCTPQVRQLKADSGHLRRGSAWSGG
jgi:hypothetical protein